MKKNNELTTKEKILKASLKLFNRDGISKVTVRDIAKEIGISHGNLCYHYPATNDIIWALYEELHKKINEKIDELHPDDNIFQALTNAMATIFTHRYHYRFFYLHIIEIGQRIPKLKKAHYNLIEKYKIKLRELLKTLRDRDLLRKDLPAEQYEFLMMHCFFYSNFWVPSGEIMFKGLAKDKIAFYLNGYLALFTPYLSEKGRKLARMAINFIE